MLKLELIQQSLTYVLFRLKRGGMRRFYILLMLVTIAMIGGGLSCSNHKVPDGEEIINTPGGPMYKANVHEAGESPWAPPIKVTELVLGADVNAPHLWYRDYIETQTGQTRNNLFTVAMSTLSPDTPIKIEPVSVPAGIKVKHAGQWNNMPHTSTRLLQIEVSKDIKPGKYMIKIRIEIDGKDYDRVPCVIKVLE
ncbi:MAG: hypothetical protein COX14_04655 [Chloroflexi bacterium CG23_combo_of_CG06-09_8_20_14_all_45_10]|nr:MAG: hypothetical protein COX14_04655 [Chloroflexi bacterium CG23_combo_of_CG06-09_8_20_14_all_45_10]